MGMGDGLTNAVVPRGHVATLRQYVKESTIANDGIVHQTALIGLFATRYPMIENARLPNWGVHFQKDETGDYEYTITGTYVLPMREGHKKSKTGSSTGALRKGRGLEIENTASRPTRLSRMPREAISAGMIGNRTVREETEPDHHNPRQRR